MSMGDLRAEQHALAQYMSSLSEEAYRAGWMDGLEYALWQVALGETREYGQAVFTDEQVSQLRRLSDASAGWIVFDEDQGEIWVTLPDWKARFQHWQTTIGAPRPGQLPSSSQASNAPYTREELLPAADGRWPERGDRCERCGVLVPRFADLSQDDVTRILGLIADRQLTAAMTDLRKCTGAPGRFAK